jgi:hypothetical protein
MSDHTWNKQSDIKNLVAIEKLERTESLDFFEVQVRLEFILVLKNRSGRMNNHKLFCTINDIVENLDVYILSIWWVGKNYIELHVNIISYLGLFSKYLGNVFFGGSLLPP